MMHLALQWGLYLHIFFSTPNILFSPYTSQILGLPNHCCCLGFSEADGQKALWVQGAFWGFIPGKERSRKQVWVEGEVRLWCEYGEVTGELQVHIIPSVVFCVGQKYLGLYPLLLSVIKCQKYVTLSKEAPYSCDRPWRSLQHGSLLTSLSTAGQLVLVHLWVTQSVWWEDNHPYAQGVVGWTKPDHPFKMLSPVAGGNHCSVILLFKVIQQILLSLPLSLSFCVFFFSEPLNFLKLFFIVLNIHNIKFTMLTVFKCMVHWH